MKVFMTLVLLFCAVPVSAEIYQWVDDKGTVSFVDDLGKVPAKYRQKAKVVGAEESGVPQVTDLSEALPDKGKKEGSADKTASGSASEQAKKKQVKYGGKDGKAWRTEFYQAKNELKSAEKHVVSLNDKLADTSKMTRNEYVGLQNSLKFAESRVAELKKSLETLNEAADRAEVPVEFRE